MCGAPGHCALWSNSIKTLILHQVTCFSFVLSIRVWPNQHITRLLAQRWTFNSRELRSLYFDTKTVDEFVYLGSNINKNNDEMMKIRKIINAANRMYFKLLLILKSRSISMVYPPVNKNKNIYNNIPYGGDVRMWIVEHYKQICRHVGPIRDKNTS